jgi:hypothetical protein
MIVELPIRRDFKWHMIIITFVGGGGGGGSGFGGGWVVVGMMVVVIVVMELCTVCIKSIVHYVQS